MSRQQNGGKGRKDLRLVKPDERVEPAELDEATDALRAAVSPGELDALDHEALLALTLGDDVLDISDEERAAAGRLRAALDGDGVGDEGLAPLAELAGALRAAHAGATLADDDHDVLIALTLGTEVEGDGDAASLARALAGGGSHPLAELAGVLRATVGRAPLSRADNEALIALTVGEDTALLAAERESSEALRRALEGEGAHALAELAGSLVATAGRPALAAADNDALVALATGVLAASVAEHEEASRLAAALDGEGEHPLVATAGALRAASGHRPGIDQMGYERLLKRAFDRAVDDAKGELKNDENPSPVSGPGRAATLVVALVALAAGFALFFGSLSWLETRRGPVATVPRAVDAELITTRSTTDLFDPLEKFPTTGGESERMEKIVSSRAADLRRNRFSRWGVQ